MIADLLLEDEVRKPLWLMTLADLFLLLVAFFVFLQANRTLDARAIGDGIRQGFGIERQPLPMAVEVMAVAGFASGSATIVTPTADAVAWAREAARDPRTVLIVIGQTDGSLADVDRVTGSAAILAADRARAVAAALARSVAPSRLRIETRTGSRAVLLHIGFAGAPATRDSSL